MTFFSVDRIEDDLVVLIGGDMEQIVEPLELFDDVPREGDVVYFEGGVYKTDREETQARRDEANRLLDRLLGRLESNDEV